VSSVTPLAPAGASHLQALTALAGRMPGLARSGLALVFGSLIASGMGMVFWTAAAWKLPPEQVGAGAALVSALTTLSHLAQLNLRNILHRFVPGTGTAGWRLIRQSYAVAAIVALVIGPAFVLLSSSVSPELTFLSSSSWAAIGFALALLIWTLFALQEAALTALHRTALIPPQSLAYSLLKIVVLLALAGMIDGGAAILVAWVLPALATGLVTHSIVLRMARSKPTALTAAQTFSWRMAIGFFGWDYLGTLSTSLALGIAPLLVLAQSGAVELAHYYLAWSISYLLYLAARHLGAAMLAEVAVNPARRRMLYAQTMLMSVLPVTAAGIGLAIAAPWIMGIFGAEYADNGAPILAVLTLASIPGAAVTAYLAICRAENKVRSIAAIQIFTLLVLATLGTALTTSMGAVGMALAWLFAHGTVVTILLARSLIDGTLLGSLIDLLTGAAHLRRDIAHFAAGLRPREPQPDLVVTVGSRQWRRGQHVTSLSDAQTTRLIDLASGRVAYLKQASTPQGRQSLSDEYRNMVHFGQDERVARLMPRILLYEGGGDETRLLLAETAGIEGRAALASPTDRAAAASAALGQLDRLNRELPFDGQIDAAWLSRWVDTPMLHLAKTHARHCERLAKIGDDLRSGLTGRALGFYHGDYCPDNVVFSDDNNAVVGLLDWGGARSDGPWGLDLISFLAALRMQQSGAQLGQVTIDWIKHPRFTYDELSWLRAADISLPSFGSERQLRVLIQLAWLQHVSANIAKSSRYSTAGFWGVANISLVVRNYDRA
jgi:O-antigen/teichoic acid export membrane protein/aminoglycoside phosphotransferase